MSIKDYAPFRGNFFPLEKWEELWQCQEVKFRDFLEAKKIREQETREDGFAPEWLYSQEERKYKDFIRPFPYQVIWKDGEDSLSGWGYLPHPTELGMDPESKEASLLRAQSYGGKKHTWSVAHQAWYAMN